MTWYDIDEQIVDKPDAKYICLECNSKMTVTKEEYHIMVYCPKCYVASKYYLGRHGIA